MEKLFLSLLPELQVVIISKRPELIPIFFRVNTYYKSLLEQEYMEQIFNEPFIPTGMAYMNKKQPIRCTLQIKNAEEINFVIHVHSLNFNSTQTTLFIPNELSQKQFNEMYYDLLYHYHMFIHQLKWVNINPCYAKNKTIVILDGWQKQYQEFVISGNHSKFVYSYHMIRTYLYLFMNKYVFNIIDHSSLERLMGLNTNIIKRDIDYLFKTLREKISLL